MSARTIWFRVGFRVEHEKNGPGTIVEATEDAIRVTFDKTDDRGKHWFGVYPLEWFTTHGNTMWALQP